MAVNVRKDIKDSSEAIKAIMLQELALISEKMIVNIMKGYRNSTEAQRINVTKSLTRPSYTNYKNVLLTALSFIASDSFDKAAKDAPKKVKLALPTEFKKLSPDLQKKLATQVDLTLEAQASDLEKAVYFQYNNSVYSTDSAMLIESDLKESATEYVTGNSISSGASVMAARVVNESRSAFFFQDDTLEQIEAFEFVNGDPVSPICQDLAGTIFAKDDPNLFRYTPPLHWNAVLEGELVLTNNGEIPIEEIKIGDKVKTKSGKFHSVYEVMNKFEDKVYYKILLEDGKEIKLTGEHPVFTKNRGWVRVDELLLLDDVMTIEDISDK